MKKYFYSFLAVVGLSLIFYTIYWTIKKNIILETVAPDSSTITVSTKGTDGKVSSSSTANITTVVPQMTLINTIIASTTATINYSLLPSGNLTYQTNNILFKNNERILTIHQGDYIGMIKEVDGKLAYTLYNSVIKKYELFYDGKKIANVPEMYSFDGVAGKLAYTTYDEIAKKQSLFYDGKKVTDDVLRYGDIGGKLFYFPNHDMRLTNTVPLFYDGKKLTDHHYYGPEDIGGKPAYTTYDLTTRHQTLFYGSEKIAEATNFVSFIFINGKFAYTSQKDDSSTVTTLFYDGKEIVSADAIDFLTGVKNNLAYTTINESKTKPTTFYGGKSLGDNVFFLKEINNKPAYMSYNTNIKGTEIWTIFYDGKKIIDTYYRAPRLFNNNGQLCYLAVMQEGGTVWDLSCDGTKLKDNVVSAQEMRGGILYTTYDEVGKKMTFYWNNNQVTEIPLEKLYTESKSESMISGYIGNMNSTSSPSYFYTKNIKDGISIFSIYKVQ